MLVLQSQHRSASNELGASAGSQPNIFMAPKHGGSTGMGKNARTRRCKLLRFIPIPCVTVQVCSHSQGLCKWRRNMTESKSNTCLCLAQIPPAFLCAYFSSSAMHPCILWPKDSAGERPRPRCVTKVPIPSRSLQNSSCGRRSA